MTFELSADRRPRLYWVDDDAYFVDAHLPAFEDLGFEVTHHPNATIAYRALRDTSNVQRGVLIVDVMLVPGDDEALFSATPNFADEEMGLLLLHRLAAHGLSPHTYPSLVCTSRAYGGFRQRAERYCAATGAGFVMKSTDATSRDCARMAREMFEAFEWG